MRRRRYQRGWGTAEYLAILAGLMVVWRGARVALELLREHYDEFSWALMIPF
ncbi:MAG TPA: hypothetical protein VIU34_33500 [Steroidobacter sp.]